VPKGKKLFLLTTSLFAVLMLLLAGCGGNNTASSSSNQTINYAPGDEPQTLDPAKATGLPDATIINAAFEGLTRYDKSGNPSPGIATSWDISPDKLTYTFHLRSDAKWSNGDPVTAQNFVDGWLRALDPATASEYAYQLYYIKGAEAYNEKKGDASGVAVKAVDDHTLQVQLTAPAPQFLGLTSFQTLMPIDGQVVKAHADWAASATNYVGDGPFKMVSWVPHQEIKMVKNPYYWDAANVKLDNLNFITVEDDNTQYTMFKNGQLNFEYNVPLAQVAQLKAGNNPDFKIMPEAATYFYRFNVTKKPLNDPRVRQALALAINREQIVTDVTKAQQTPAFAFVPPGFNDANGSDFRQNGGDYFKEDVAQAQKLLAEAGYPGGKGFPALSILYNSGANHQEVAEAIQAMWQKNLNINVTLHNEEWQAYLNDMSKLNYDVARAGWMPDYMYPMTFMDMFVTGGGNNETGWSNPDYDALIQKAKTSDAGTPAAFADMHQAEKILMTQMPITPIYFYTQPVLIKPELKDVIIPPFGVQAEFRWAYVGK